VLIRGRAGRTFKFFSRRLEAVISGLSRPDCFGLSLEAEGLTSVGPEMVDTLVEGKRSTGPATASELRCGKVDGACWNRKVVAAIRGIRRDRMYPLARSEVSDAITVP
jgi:hypothetical protein